MNPDVAGAIEDLERKGILSPGVGAFLLRVARRELVSVRAEIRVLLYAGVLLITGGVGALVKQNLDRIGPVGVAAGIGLAAAACFFWIFWCRPPFSWGELPSPNLAFDYVLLLGVLLTAADLAYIEVQFTPLGSAWPYHLLLVSLLAGALAIRFDSRIVLSVAMTSFASWRSVSLPLAEPDFWADRPHAFTLNALACGAVFLVLGRLAISRSRKAHFEPVAAYMGCLVVLVGLAGCMGAESAWGMGYKIILVGAGAAIAAWGVAGDRYGLFVLGVLGGYVGLSALALEVSEDLEVMVFWFAASSVLLVAGLHLGRRWMLRRQE